MSKRFGSFTAVDNLQLQLYRDEIFCFLGHNGAGKTTSLNVLMGKESPTDGTVKLTMDDDHTLDIRDDLLRAQSLMGTCSQHDILFDTLTVEQHIMLFYKLKENLLSDLMTTSQLSQRVDQLIATVNLQSHRHVQAQSLSGGMRRRLSIALALVSPSESSIVILDEPTTGLDAMVRDQVWQLIKELRKNRCIVMTTQHLEEAEELADQVALLDMGKMVAKGSVDEIKKKFGIGYNLVVSHEDSKHESERLREIVNRNVPGCTFDSGNSSATKSHFTLPFQAVDQFAHLFECLESEGFKFNLRQTTLEDAFVNFATLKKNEKAKGDAAANESEDPESQRERSISELARMDNASGQADGCKLFLRQFTAMFLKRWHSFKRDWRMWLITILPSALIWCLLVLGFSREYVPVEMRYSQGLIGNNTADVDGKLFNMQSQGKISSMIRDLSFLTQHGNGQ